MNIKYKQKLVSRLHIIEGQVKGLEKMLMQNKYCINIITQSLAVQKSLQSFDREMLKNHMEEHVVHQFHSGQHAKAIKELLKVYSLNSK
jgi:DNA-binding FrmR family transcriptional regulator